MQKLPKKLEAQMQAELEEENRLARLKEEETNIALVAKWDNTQAMMDADCEPAARLQEEEREELTIEEKSRLFVELMDKRKKHFARLRAEKIRNDDDVTIEATPISSKSPTIVDYKIYKKGGKAFSKSSEQM
nr:hypothetical protein [Tanacetum cinerariifolium]